jgi:heme-degrading monooxygenase HmoA
VIVRISSAIVPSPGFDEYLEDLRTALPVYEAAAGLLWVAFLQRPFVAYVEVVTLSVWKSEQAMARFIGSTPTKNNPASPTGVIELNTHAYELLVSTDGKFQDAEDI